MDQLTRVGLLGTPVSSGNRGVLALGASLVGLITGGDSDVETVLFLGHRDNKPVKFWVGGQDRNVPIVNCRLSFRSRPCEHLMWIMVASVLYRLLPFRRVRNILSQSTPWVAELEGMRFVGDVRGGDSFSDIYGMGRFLTGFCLAWSVILVKGTIVQFPQTYGPYERPLARWLARRLLRRSRIIVARDKASREVAQRLVGPWQAVWISPDVAFSLDTKLPDAVLMDPPLTGLWVGRKTGKAQPAGAVESAGRTVVGVNVNGLMFNGGYTRDNMFRLKLDYAAFLVDVLCALLSAQAHEIWLVPHTYAAAGHVESDPEACYKVRNALSEGLRSRVRLVTGEYNCHELKGIIGACDFFVGSRMHACIAALSQGVPCVGVAYSMKFRGVFETVDMGEWVIDARDFNVADAVRKTLGLYERRESVREGLRMRADDAQTALRTMFARIAKECVV